VKGKPLEMTLLYDFYGDVLTDNQKDLFDLYHNHDYSLAEVAENANITRQGVRDVVVRAEQVLRDLEEKLGLIARSGRTREQALKIRKAAEYIDTLSQSPDSMGVRMLSEQINTIKALAQQIIEEN